MSQSRLSWCLRERGGSLRLAIAATVLLGIGIAIVANAKSGAPGRTALKPAETFKWQVPQDLRPIETDRVSAPMRDFTALIPSSHKPKRWELIRPILERRRLLPTCSEPRHRARMVRYGLRSDSESTSDALCPRLAVATLAYRGMRAHGEKRRDRLVLPARKWSNERIIAGSGPYPRNSDRPATRAFAHIEPDVLSVAIGTATGVSGDLLFLNTFPHLSSTRADPALGTIDVEE